MYFIELAHHLSQDQKDMTIKAVVCVALADRDLKVKGEVLLLQVGDGLGVKVARVKEIMQAESHHHRENNKILDKTKEEEESRRRRVSCVIQIMRADFHCPNENHDIPDTTEEDEEVEA
jgi:DNA-binding transcriptional MerR regulator